MDQRAVLDALFASVEPSNPNARYPRRTPPNQLSERQPPATTQADRQLLDTIFASAGPAAPPAQTQSRQESEVLVCAMSSLHARVAI
jgi:hypothetical protein